jgi:hypothetical protein
VLALATLWALKRLEHRIPLERTASVIVRADDGPTAIEAMTNLAKSLDCQAVFDGQYRDPTASDVSVAFEVSWRRDDISGPPLRLFEALNARFRMEKFEIRSASD